MSERMDEDRSDLEALAALGAPDAPAERVTALRRDCLAELARRRRPADRALRRIWWVLEPSLAAAVGVVYLAWAFGAASGVWHGTRYEPSALEPMALAATETPLRPDHPA